MQDLIAQISGYARGMWRYRWYAQLVAWPLCIAGWIVVYMLPSQYEATARVFVDTQSMLRPLLQGLAVQSNTSEQVQMMTRTLLSRPNIEKIARMADLDLQAKTPEEMELLLNRLAKRIGLTNAGRDNIFSISFTHSDPQIARQVVQSLLTLFVESSLGDNRKDSSAAQRFLEEQIKEYEARLSAAEDRLKDFKRQNVSVMPSEGRGYYDRLSTEKATLERATLELHEAVNRRDELRRQLSGEEPSLGMVLQPLPSPRASTSLGESRIQTLEAKLDDLLLRFTDEHPDVVALRKQIDEQRALEKKRQDAVQAKQPVRTPTLDANPVYQQLKVALGNAEANVVVLQVRVKEYESRVAQLNTLVDTVPQVEAELARLNRDYAINKQNYESLITRRESAKISEEAEQSSDNLKFKIVDPPRVPLSPVAPNRPLLASAVLLAGIGAGVLFTLFLSQIKLVFDNYRSVLAETSVPVLGYVSMVWTDSMRMKYRIEVITYVVITGALITIYALYLALHMFSRGVSH